MFVQWIVVANVSPNTQVCTNIMLFTLTQSHIFAITVVKRIVKHPHLPCIGGRHMVTILLLRQMLCCFLLMNLDLVSHYINIEQMYKMENVHYCTYKIMFSSTFDHMCIMKCVNF